MDNTSQPLATESFSYSWLESQQHKTISNSNNHYSSVLLDETTTFDFDISNSKSNPSSLVHADKLFSNGLILPRSLDEPPNNASSINRIIASSSSSSSPSPLLVNSKIYHHPSSSFRRIFLGKCSRFIPRKTFSKCVRCLIPVKESIGRGGGGTRVNDVNRLTWEEVASPKKEIAAYSSTWSDLDESSIRDAILYCKRSSGLC